MLLRTLSLLPFLTRAENRTLSLSLSLGKAMRRAPVLLCCCFCASLLLCFIDPASVYVSARQLSLSSTPTPSEENNAAPAPAASPLAAEEEPPPRLPLLLASADAAQPPLGSPSKEEEVGEFREEDEEQEDEADGFIITLGGDGSFSEEAPSTSSSTTDASASSSSSPTARPFAAELVHVSGNSSLLDLLYGEGGGEEGEIKASKTSKLPVIAEQALAAAAALAAGVGVGALIALLATRLWDLWKYRRAGGRVIMHPSMAWARWVRGRVRVRRTRRTRL